MQSNFAELYEKSFQDIKIGEVVKGTVIAVHERDVVIDIAYKAEGILAKDEFPQPELLVVGAEVEVLFEGFNDVEGTAILSKRKADRQKTWNDILSNATEGAIVDGRICRMRSRLVLCVPCRCPRSKLLRPVFMTPRALPQPLPPFGSPSSPPTAVSC